MMHRSSALAFCGKYGADQRRKIPLVRWAVRRSRYGTEFRNGSQKTKCLDINEGGPFFQIPFQIHGVIATAWISSLMNVFPCSLRY